jgi:uncharacterized membrane protein YphA (DoxX/SURF4 family)
MKTIMWISRIFVGSIFIVSGFVKAIDPDGFAIKLSEYFLAFHMEFLDFLSYPIAIFFSSVEFMIGLNLLFRLRMRFTAWLLLIFMSFFTLLTFILALTNPVTDCGCFGDFIKLTNWETFGKNVILFIPTMVLFLFRKRYDPKFSLWQEWFLSFVNFLLPAFLSLYCLKHEPIIDFRPYKTGTSIPDKMNIPENAPVDQFEITMIYEKNGVQKEFSETDIPWQDTTWKWVDRKEKLISRGYEPPIHDFAISDLSGNDITQTILNNSSYTFLIIAPKLEKGNLKDFQKLNDISKQAANLDITTYCLTSSTTDEIQRFITDFQPDFIIGSCDETVLKTILRSTTGLMVLQQGTILAKWSARDAIKASQLKKNMTEVILLQKHKLQEWLIVFLLASFLIILYMNFIRVFRN